MASSGSESGDISSDLSKSPDFSQFTLDDLKSREDNSVPLNTPWTFWLDKAHRGTTAAEFEAGLRKIYTVGTVQSFWAVFHNVPSVSDLPVRYTYHLMRDERQPLWEEPCNMHGGTWRLKCSKRETPQVWQELLLAAIGEQLSEFVASEDSVCGVSVSVRDRDDIVQVWNTDAASANKATIFKAIHDLLPEVQFQTEFYKPHQTHHAYEGAK